MLNGELYAHKKVDKMSSLFEFDVGETAGLSVFVIRFHKLFDSSIHLVGNVVQVTEIDCGIFENNGLLACYNENNSMG